MFTDQWSIPYKKEESLGKCLVASTRLAEEGKKMSKLDLSVILMNTGIGLQWFYLLCKIVQFQFWWNTFLIRTGRRHNGRTI